MSLLWQFVLLCLNGFYLNIHLKGDMNANTIRLQFQQGQIDACAIAALFASGQLSPLAFTGSLA